MSPSPTSSCGFGALPASDQACLCHTCHRASSGTDELKRRAAYFEALDRVAPPSDGGSTWELLYQTIREAVHGATEGGHELRLRICTVERMSLRTSRATWASAIVHRAYAREGFGEDRSIRGDAVYLDPAPHGRSPRRFASNVRSWALSAHE